MAAVEITGILLLWVTFTAYALLLLFANQRRRRLGPKGTAKNDVEAALVLQNTIPIHLEVIPRCRSGPTGWQRTSTGREECSRGPLSVTESSRELTLSESTLTNESFGEDESGSDGLTVQRHGKADQRATERLRKSPALQASNREPLSVIESSRELTLSERSLTNVGIDESGGDGMKGQRHGKADQRPTGWRRKSPLLEESNRVPLSLIESSRELPLSESSINNKNFENDESGSDGMKVQRHGKGDQRPTGRRRKSPRLEGCSRGPLHVIASSSELTYSERSLTNESFGIDESGSDGVKGQRHGNGDRRPTGRRRKNPRLDECSRGPMPVIESIRELSLSESTRTNESFGNDESGSDGMKGQRLGNGDQRPTGRRRKNPRLEECSRGPQPVIESIRELSLSESSINNGNVENDESGSDGLKGQRHGNGDKWPTGRQRKSPRLEECSPLPVIESIRELPLSESSINNGNVENDESGSDGLKGQRYEKGDQRPARLKRRAAAAVDALISSEEISQKALNGSRHSSNAVCDKGSCLVRKHSKAQRKEESHLGKEETLGTARAQLGVRSPAQEKTCSPNRRERRSDRHQSSGSQRGFPCHVVTEIDCKAEFSDALSKSEKAHETPMAATILRERKLSTKQSEGPQFSDRRPNKQMKSKKTSRVLPTHVVTEVDCKAELSDALSTREKPHGAPMAVTNVREKKLSTIRSEGPYVSDGRPNKQMKPKGTSRKQRNDRASYQDSSLLSDHAANGKMYPRPKDNRPRDDPSIGSECN